MQVRKASADELNSDPTFQVFKTAGGTGEQEHEKKISESAVYCSVFWNSRKAVFYLNNWNSLLLGKLVTVHSSFSLQHNDQICLASSVFALVTTYSYSS